jgi:hypothetical protein
MNRLNWQTWHMRFVAGLNQKADARTLESPELAVCKDVMFDKLGGLQTRYPFALTSNDIFGGGTLSDWRVLAENGDELLLFTKDTLYSWNAQLSKWVAKGTHLAVKVDETPRFVSPGDQVDGDRAELSGTIVYAWTELLGSSSKGYVAALDKTTGNVLMAPTPLAGSAARLRVTALTTKILLTFYDGIAGLYAYALDPASPATALAGSSTTRHELELRHVLRHHARRRRRPGGVRVSSQSDDLLSRRHDHRWPRRRDRRRRLAHAMARSR